MRYLRLHCGLAVSLFFLVFAGSPGEPAAHEFHPERQLFVQVFPEHVDVMIVYVEAPGERTEFFRLQYGMGLDSSATGQLARRAILPRMLDGLEFEVPGESPVTHTPEVKVDDEGSRLRAAAWVRYELEELDDGQRRTMVLRTAERSFLPTSAIVYGGGGLEPVDGVSVAAPAGGPARAVLELHRGQEHAVTFHAP